jgi:MinD superfamily P-loop ATPase
MRRSRLTSQQPATSNQHMKEITVISGKGGTGKTSITAALASVYPNAVFCDCDVDAADLHLIFNPEKEETHVFEGAWVAEIDANKCTNCGICEANCRFEAISLHPKNNSHSIDPFKCEGCRLCERLCPEEAITSERSKNNFWYISNSRFGKLVHASMGPGEENSGKLVSQVRKVARDIAKKTEADLIINDGPPGIGCAAISSITGCDEVILVIEPSKSGIHDIKRVIELTNSFNIPARAIINKSDLNINISSELESYLKSSNINVIAKLPYSSEFTQAQTLGLNIIEHAPSSSISQTLKSINPVNQ